MSKRVLFQAMKKILHLTDHLEEVLVVMLLGTLVICLTSSIAIRYALPIFSKASHWAEEISVFSFVWVLYWGASLATLRGSHYRVTFQFMLVPKSLRKYAFIPGNIVLFLFNIFICYLGWILINNSIEESLSLQIPMKYIYSIIPISFGLITIRLLQQTIASLKNERNEGSKNV